MVLKSTAILEINTPPPLLTSILSHGIPPLCSQFLNTTLCYLVEQQQAFSMVLWTCSQGHRGVEMGPMVVTMDDVRLPTHPNGWVIDNDGKAIVPKYMYLIKRFWKWRAVAEQGSPQPPPYS